MVFKDSFFQRYIAPIQGGSDKVTRSCDKNVDESAILRIPSFSVELTLVYFYSLYSCLVFSVYR